jgi:hypothetical protein
LIVHRSTLVFPAQCFKFQGFYTKPDCKLQTLMAACR